jgi:hypothetical protein
MSDSHQTAGTKPVERLDRGGFGKAGGEGRGAEFVSWGGGVAGTCSVGSEGINFMSAREGGLVGLIVILDFEFRS